MQMERVWNISDDPRTKCTPITIMVLGKAVAPGSFVRVPVDRLKLAHKIHKDVERKLLFIGRLPPKSYMAIKKPPRAELAPGVARAHGPLKGPEAQKPAPKETPKEPEKLAESTVKDVNLYSTAMVTDKVDTELKPAGGKKKKGKG